MGELLFRIKMVLIALDAQRDYRPATSVRLAGFASIILRVARHEGWEAEAKDLIDTWHQEQVEAALEGEEVAEIIAMWMSQPHWKPVKLSTEELNRYDFAPTEDQLSLLRAKGTGEPAQAESEPEIESQEEML